MNKEELMLQKRLVELSKTAYYRSCTVFSDFLNLNELHILQSTPKDLFYTQYQIFGGYKYAERQMAAFLPDALSFVCGYPICVLQIFPAYQRFAEPLTHRDYLGAILNLGIARSKIGDLAVEDERCLVFCMDHLADYIAEELSRVRHTIVRVEKSELSECSYHPKLKGMTGSVASVRLDSVLAIAFPLSRSKLTGFIEGGKVFVNGKMITNNGYRLKEQDIISVRGMGRILYGGILSETRKGRYRVQIYQY